MDQLKRSIVIALFASATAFAQTVSVRLPAPHVPAPHLPAPHVRVQVAPAPSPVVVRETVVVRKHDNGKHKGHHKH